MDRPRVLGVDDEASARQVLDAALHADGYELVLADSVPAALAMLATSRIDLVLCDAMMPEVDGFELCRKMKTHPEWRDIPIVLVTALDGSDDMVRAIEAGADDFLSKPVQRIVLRARVRAMLRIRARLHELHRSSTDVESVMRRRRERIIDSAGLSVREQQVLELLLLGRTHDDIGVLLGISARTAKHHQANVLGKLGADSRVDLIRIFA